MTPDPDTLTRTDPDRPGHRHSRKFLKVGLEPSAAEPFVGAPEDEDEFVNVFAFSVAALNVVLDGGGDGSDDGLGLGRL